MDKTSIAAGRTQPLWFSTPMLGASWCQKSGEIGSEERPALSDIEARVGQHIRQAASAGLGIRKLVAETGLSFDVVLGAVLFLYTDGDIQCFVESEDVRCVAR